MLPAKPTLAILTALACLQLVHLRAGRRNWDVIASAFDLTPRRPPEIAPPDPVIPEVRRGDSVLRLLQPDTLDRFYEALDRTERKEPGAVTRILHYGDSPTTADLITADVRDLLQRRFGDAGHGFILADQPWAWYTHRGVDVRGDRWKIAPATQSSLRDGMYGLGGVSFEGPAGATSRFSLAARGHTSVEVAFLLRPDGGTFTVSADDRVLQTVDTAAATAAPGFASIPIPAATRRISIEVERGDARLFGASLTKPATGVVYSSLGLNGGYVSVLARIFAEKHWREQLRHYRPHLVIINYGTNESVYDKFVDFAYEKEMKEILRRLRVALPDTPILIMSPMDRGERQGSGEIGTPPALVRLVGLQEKVARENACAFFNTFQAMGGAGTMARWYQSSPRLVGADYLHPMPAGAKQIGTMLFRAIMDGYHQHKLHRMRENLSQIGGGR